MSKTKEYEVDVEIRGTIRVQAVDEDDALDMAACYVESGVVGIDVHHVVPLRSSEV